MDFFNNVRVDEAIKLIKVQFVERNVITLAIINTFFGVTIYEL